MKRIYEDMGGAYKDGFKQPAKIPRAARPIGMSLVADGTFT
jgi:hypothetical protein